MVITNPLSIFPNKLIFGFRISKPFLTTKPIVWDRTSIGPMNGFYQSIARILEDEQNGVTTNERETMEATGINLRELSAYLMKVCFLVVDKICIY